MSEVYQIRLIGGASAHVIIPAKGMPLRDIEQLQGFLTFVLNALDIVDKEKEKPPADEAGAEGSPTLACASFRPREHSNIDDGEGQGDE